MAVSPGRIGKACGAVWTDGKAICQRPVGHMRVGGQSGGRADLMDSLDETYGGVEMNLPNVVTTPEDPILREASWPDGHWPAGLLDRPRVGGRRGYRERNWAQAVALEKLTAIQARNGIPEMARLLCLAEAAMGGRYAVLRCRKRLWPIVRRLLDA